MRQIPITPELISEHSGSFMVRDGFLSQSDTTHRHIRRKIHAIDNEFFYYGRGGRRRFIVRAEEICESPKIIRFIVN